MYLNELKYLFGGKKSQFNELAFFIWKMNLSEKLSAHDVQALVEQFLVYLAKLQ